MRGTFEQNLIEISQLLGLFWQPFSDEQLNFLARDPENENRLIGRDGVPQPARQPPPEDREGGVVRLQAGKLAHGRPKRQKSASVKNMSE